jgi:hypothetical protein
MPDTRIDPETAAASARQLLEKSVEDRVTAVRTLIVATNAVDAADQAAKDARDAHTKAWDAALASGWSDKDLRATGARPPGQATRRPRTRRTTDTPPTEPTTNHD